MAMATDEAPTMKDRVRRRLRLRAESDATWVKSKHIARHLDGCSRTRAGRILSELADEGLVEKFSESRTAVWRITMDENGGDET